MMRKGLLPATTTDPGSAMSGSLSATSSESEGVSGRPKSAPRGILGIARLTDSTRMTCAVPNRTVIELPLSAVIRVMAGSIWLATGVSHFVEAIGVDRMGKWRSLHFAQKRDRHRRHRRTPGRCASPRSRGGILVRTWRSPQASAGQASTR